MEKISNILNKIVVLIVICMGVAMLLFLIKMKAWIFIALIAMVVAVYWNIGRIRRERLRKNIESSPEQNTDEEAPIKEKEEV